jgi:hypothetical protein
LLRDVLGLGISREFLLLLILAAIASLVVPGPNRTRRISLFASIVVWSVVVLVATRRPPPPRVWLFTVPFACLFAGAGLDEIIRLVSRSAQAQAAARERVLAAAAVVIIVGALAVQNFQYQVVRESEETDYYGLREASSVAHFLLPQLRPGDRVVAARTTGLPLDYYLLRLGRRRLAEFDSGAVDGRVFVIVNERHRQGLATLEGMRADIPWASLPTPRETWRLDGARVFEASAVPTSGVRPTEAARER